MNSYELKQEQRRERLEQAAEDRQAEAARRFQAGRDAVAGIPFGQPILVGHHSEGRHRAALRRQDSNMRKGCEAMDAAEDLARRAAAVGTGGISSDDPEAIEKLTDKRTDLERRRDDMKSLNAWHKKHGTVDGWASAQVGRDPEAMHAFEQEGRRVQQIWNNPKLQPFPPYALSNIGARIRDAAKRAERIEAVASLEESTETVGLATITVDPSDNRVSVSFPSRLTKDDYKAMRSAGFLWSPSRNAFVRKISNAALYHARTLAARITTLEG